MDWHAGGPADVEAQASPIGRRRLSPRTDHTAVRPPSTNATQPRSAMGSTGAITIPERCRSTAIWRSKGSREIARRSPAVQSRLSAPGYRSAPRRLRRQQEAEGVVLDELLTEDGSRSSHPFRFPHNGGGIAAFRGRAGVMNGETRLALASPRAITRPISRRAPVTGAVRPARRNEANGSRNASPSAATSGWPLH